MTKKAKLYEVGQRERWAKHFHEVFNQPTPSTIVDIPSAEEQLIISKNPPTKVEIIKVIKFEKDKAADPNGSPLRHSKHVQQQQQ
jgi:hypothetical protein